MTALARGPPSTPGSDTAEATFALPAELRRIIVHDLPSESDHARADAAEAQGSGERLTGTQAGGRMDVDAVNETETLYGSSEHSTARRMTQEVCWHLLLNMARLTAPDCRQARRDRSQAPDGSIAQ